MKYRTFDSLFSWGNKSQIKSGEGKDEGVYPFFVCSDKVVKRYNEPQCNEQSLIFGTGGQASLHYCDEPFSYSTDCVVAHAQIPLNLKYYYYFFRKSNLELLQNGFKGSGLQHISKKYIDKLLVPVVSIEEQNNAVLVLDSIQSSIDIKRKELSEFDELVKSKFVEMFGDVIVNSKNWESYPLKEIATSRLGKMLDRKKQTGLNFHPYLANFNVQWFYFNLSELHEMDFDEEDRKEFKLECGDLLVCEGGEVGRCAVWENEIDCCFFQKAIHRVRCNQKLINPYYLSFWFYANSMFNQFEDVVGKQVTIAHLTGVKLKELIIPTPPIALQEEFSSFVKNIDSLKSIVKKQISDLEELMNSKMDEYFS